MAKPTATKPVLKTAAADTASAPVVKTRNRDKVLVLKTANELIALIGGDTPVGVSRKSLLTIITKQKIGDLKADAGL